MSGSDTTWLLVSTALVMLMTPGLALFYGGMVQSKNVLSTFMHSFFAMGLVSVQFAVIGYSLAFGHSHGGVIGGFDYVGLAGITEHSAHGTVPQLAFVAYQCMFAVITPALISGAFAERMKFSAFILFTLAWTTLVYDPIAHWVWGDGGWLAKLGAIDYAGGTVVHLSSGISALVVAIVLGKRAGYPSVRHPPHNLAMTVTGAGILWFGWFGFNAGAAGANGTAALALLNTHLAAAAAAVTWAVIEALRIRKMTMLGVASGLVAGLVAITPAAGYVSPMVAMLIGVVASCACFAAVLAKSRLGYDDALDAFGVHGVGGATGALLTGVFARAALNNGVGGSASLLAHQAIGLAAAGAWAALVTYVLLKILDALVGLRVEIDDEREGLDTALHGESAYGSAGAVHEG
ncbi:MAG: ammonium transporter [Kofleriaceae bacterium]